jgi:hypothetical protein
LIIGFVLSLLGAIVLFFGQLGIFAGQSLVVLSIEESAEERLCIV